MVRSDGKLHSLQVGSQMSNFPDNGQALLISIRVILFRLLRVHDQTRGEEFPTGLLLGQTTAILTIRGIRV
jgi:hypothetical protein